MSYLIYLPAYNEEDHIDTTIQSIQSAVKNIPDVNILVVNDGSTDQTSSIAQQNGAIVLEHSHNYGVGRAFQTALKYAIEQKVDILISIDADGQFDPQDIPTFIKLIQDNKATMITGNRFENGRPEYMPWLKYRGNQIVGKLVSTISHQKLMDVSCGFRAYSRDALLHLNIFGEFTYTHETILDLASKGLTIKEVPIKVKYFSNRKSRVAGNILKYAYQSGKIIFRVMMNFRALRVLGITSLFFFLTGAFFETYLLVHYAIAGQFTPYKAFGFIGLGFILFGSFILFFALIADLINRLRANQERILYQLKKNNDK